MSEPTHHHSNILDLLLTNMPNKICNLSIDTATCSTVSDHHLVSFTVNLTLHDNRKCQGSDFNYQKGDFEGLDNFFFDVSFSECLTSSDMETIWSFFKRIFFSGCDIFIPKYKRKQKENPAWFNYEIRHQVKCVRTLKHLTKHKPNTCRLTKLSSLQVGLQNLFQSAK